MGDFWGGWLAESFSQSGSVVGVTSIQCSSGSHKIAEQKGWGGQVPQS